MKIRYILIAALLSICLTGISQTGETILLGNVAKSGSADDESYGPFDIGFNFIFYGNNYTQFYVNSNGQVLFGAGSTVSDEVAIPNASAPNNYIAALWDDLEISSSGKILYTTIGASPNRKLIIQATNMGFYPYPIFMGTYLIILYETSNKIQVQYRIIIDGTSERAHGGSATIGIENSTGTAGVQYAYHSSTAISTWKAISLTPSGPTYTMDTNAEYDPVVLTTNLTLPDPGIPSLLSPPQDAVIGPDHTFEWSESSNAESYTLLISHYSDIGGATSYDADTNRSYLVTGLTLDTTYYWGVFASNATGTTWCEIKRFKTSSAPPLEAVPQTVWVEQNQEKTIKLNYTGGDASAKTAIVTSLPAQGQLYQYNAGIKGVPISSVPATVTDAGRNIIYSATGSAGMGVGNFSFKIHDDTGDSPEAQDTVNVSPPGMPNLLYTGKTTTYIEMQFDRIMANPAGKENQFTVTVNGAPAAVSSLSLKTGDPYTIIATLETPILLTDVVIITYTAGDITSAQGGYLPSFDPQTVTLQAQTITFTQSLNKKYGELPFILTATASSSLSMTYSSSNLTVAIISGNVLTILYVGTSEITARQAGNATYAPAKYIRTLTVSKGDQTIIFNTLQVKTYGDDDFTISATASSGLTVAFASSNTAVATVEGTTVHITGGGTTTITASQAGNTLWNPAPNVPQILTVNKADQTITFNALPVKTYGDADFTLTATSSSGLPVSFASGNTLVATVTGDQLHITGAGTTTITASQAGNANYNPAPDVPQTLTVNKAGQTITFNALPDKTFGDPDFDPGASANSGLTISYSSDNSAVATITANNIHIAGAGTAVITASQPGNTNYNPAVDVSQTLTVNKAVQTITFTDYPENLFVAQSYTLAATSSGAVPVLFESMNTGIATISGNQITGVEGGNVQIRAYNDGGQNYLTAEAFVTVEVISSHRNIMNLFTPNNDGFNDLWELPELQTWGKCEVRIFSRAGKLVFADDNYNNTWNGTMDGKPVPEGPYYYVIKTANAGTVSGTVNIVR